MPSEDDYLNVADKVGTGAALVSADPLTALIHHRAFGPGPTTPSYDGSIGVGDPYAPRSPTSPGLLAGNPNAGFDWMDKTAPGMHENYIAQNIGRMGGPSATGAFNREAQQFMNGPTASGHVGRSLEADPDFNAYYDNARARQGSTASDVMAARGLGRASAALDLMMQGQSDLNAEQANREADYMQQHQAQRLQAAGQADTARQGLYGLGQDAATAADSAGVSRFTAGANAAAGAQAAREKRINDLYAQRASAAYNAMAAANPWLLSSIGADATGFGNAAALETGTSAEALNIANHEVNRGFEYANAGVEGGAAVIDAVKTAKTGGMG